MFAAIEVLKWAPVLIVAALTSWIFANAYWWADQQGLLFAAGRPGIVTAPGEPVRVAPRISERE